MNNCPRCRQLENESNKLLAQLVTAEERIKILEKNQTKPAVLLMGTQATPLHEGGLRTQFVPTFGMKV